MEIKEINRNKWEEMETKRDSLNCANNIKN